MKIIKKVLIGLAALIALILIVALFVNPDYRVEREVIINKPRQQVFDYVKIQKNHQNYNKWWKVDPGMKQEFRGTDGTPGFVTAWDSKNNDAGKGEQEITKIAEGAEVDCEIRFERPFEGKSYTAMTTEAIADDQTKVKWVFTGRSHYPARILNLAMDMTLGKDLQISLNDLKGILEKQ